MRAMIVIARNTFREALRDRVLYLFLGFAVVMLVSSKIFGLLTVGDEGKVIKDLGLAGVQEHSVYAPGHHRQQRVGQPGQAGRARRASHELPPPLAAGRVPAS